MNQVGTNVAAQYSEHVYPQTSLLAKPVRAATHPISYEYAQYLRTGCFVPHHSGTHILVAGSGSFEPIVVAKAHPHAQIHAVDFSATSLARLRKHALMNLCSHQIRTYHLDLTSSDALKMQFGEKRFDYIICVGMLQHTDQPKIVLQNLRSLLKDSAVLRLMTYAKNSRFWIYELQKYFNARGLTANTPELQKRCLKALNEVLNKSTRPSSNQNTNPYYTAFTSYSDIHTVSGLIDGFFHSYDHPLAVSELRMLCKEFDLYLTGFGHAWHSQPQSLSAVFKNAANTLNAWDRAEIMDDFHEFSINPVFLLTPEIKEVSIGFPDSVVWNPPLASLKNYFVPFPVPLAPEQLFSNQHESNSGEVRLLRLQRKFVNSFSSLNDSTKQALLHGGIVLGTQNCLPQSLAENRVVSDERHFTKSQQGNNFYNSIYNQSLNEMGLPKEELERLSIELLKDLQSGIQKCGFSPGNTNYNRFLEMLKDNLSTQVDKNGNPLPYLSLRDWFSVPPRT